MKLKLLKPSEIIPNPDQPRKKFEGIPELASSIKKHGLIQPLTVVKRGKKYVLVAGERRWRAHKKIGMKCFAVVKDSFKPEDYVVENELRENLTDKELFKYTFAMAKREKKDMWNPNDLNGKGWPKVSKVAEFITGRKSQGSDLPGKSRKLDPFYQKLVGIYRREKALKEGDLSPKVAKAIEEGIVSKKTADKIIKSDMPHKLQENIVAIAKAKSPSEVAKEIEWHNIGIKAKKMRDDQEANRIKYREDFVLKLINSIQDTSIDMKYCADLLWKYSKKDIAQKLTKAEQQRIRSKANLLLKTIEDLQGGANSILGNLRLK